LTLPASTKSIEDGTPLKQRGETPEHSAINFDNETLRAHISAGELSVLLITVAHLTGDVSLLRREWRPKLEWGSFIAQHAPDQEAEARALCLRRLIEFRDSGRTTPRRPHHDIMQQIVTWSMGDDAEALIPMLSEQIVFGEDDLQTPRWSKEKIAPDRKFEVAIVGAGESGLLMAHRLKQANVPFVIYEKNPEVGGTWLENNYPGCRVDVNSFIYSFTFAKKCWREYFGVRDQILAHLKECSVSLGLNEHVRFNTEVLASRWIEEDSVWETTILTPAGQETVRSNVIISSVGQLNRPSFSKIANRKSFGGSSFHSSCWDYSVDLTGKRVGVIGTGASAMQFVPHVARQAAELSVFFRTAPWLLPQPKLQQAVEDDLQWLLENVPNYAQWHRLWVFMPQFLGVFDASIVDPDYPPTERAISAKNEELRVFLTQKIDEQIADRPDLRPMVVPSAPPGSKRMVCDNGSWISALKRSNVRIVSEVIERISPEGIMTADGRNHDLDVLIYGTGFQSTQFLMPMRITGRNSVDLHEMWDQDPRAYLGSTITGFPNLFCLYGPNTNAVVHGASIIFVSECGVNYAVDAIHLMLEGGYRVTEIRKDVFNEYNARVDRANKMRAWGWSKVNNWYKNEKGRVTQNWPFTYLELWQRTRQIVPDEYDLS
jgi:4-hydroxyacetophenone monooxygenase